ncbi:tryptophan--tRNA ligase [Paraclostridium bifermentans]|uniref:tryptophan--tRNA ligase n=1 Tax=Paraclostridium bifermentans TaxID=1490 RepID=UPI001EEF6252|nr:tryptophan--tRNA ligase [Paraclostridium bifermentans]MCE9675546.1 tryptophan--tRNA ligase [Paraclostridium bifermentans]MDV8108589.1 tryptophan--tRNA ligase [Bacillus sp. BAU-SS-2023]UOW67412.1 tryptophan--tRNA ligase [Paraclostridium bifermentans]
MSEKKIIFSGAQPSGKLTLGNYLGAIKNWKELQEDYNCYYSVVDLHAITVPQEAKNLRANTMQLLAQYMASGLDPEKNTIFIQSHVSCHTELMWILNTMTYMGELSRMTQFKDKSQKSEANLNAGLFTYPVLMAADILLYQTDLVPVGEDQKQHLELARDLANRFNNRYSPTFKVPEPYIPKAGARVMSLQEPTKKMSKSDENENGYILLVDDADTIRRKIKRSVTDSVGVVRYSDEQPGIKNLLDIYSKLDNKSIEDLVAMYEGKGYGDFKNDVAEVIVETLKPIKDQYEYLLSNKDYLEDIYAKGAQKAEYQARKTLRKVYKKVGLIEKKFL